MTQWLDRIFRGHRSALRDTRDALRDSRTDVTDLDRTWQEADEATERFEQFLESDGDLDSLEGIALRSEWQQKASTFRLTAEAEARRQGLI